ncbi:MAG: ribosome hibernation-promoting factor, HPF/YfiA family [Rectinemataceae bacterium]
MTIDVRSVHFDLGDASREYLDKKLERVTYAKDIIVDMIFIFTREKEFKGEVTINFRKGTQAHLEETDYEIQTTIDKLIDRMEQKITKEKDKMQEHK